MQAHNTDSSRGPNSNYQVGDKVMLSAKNCWHEYKKRGERRAAKFFPRWDGPYMITAANPSASTCTLDLPANTYLHFHDSKLKAHHENDATLFPARAFAQPEAANAWRAADVLGAGGDHCTQRQNRTTWTTCFQSCQRGSCSLGTVGHHRVSKWRRSICETLSPSQNL